MKPNCIKCGISRQQGTFRVRRNDCVSCERTAHNKYIKDNPVAQMILNARHRAKRDGIPCLLTRGDVTIPKTCPILGIKLKVGNRKDHDASPTIDKIIPSKGYIKGNVVVISHRANRIKSDATLPELRRLVKFLSSLSS